VRAHSIKTNGIINNNTKSFSTTHLTKHTMTYYQNLSILKTFWKSGATRNGMFAMLAAVVLGASSMMLGSCAQQATSPSSGSEASLSDAAQADNSRDAADVIATSVGTSSGGSGMIFTDAMTLAHGDVIPDAVLHTLSSDTTTVHIATVTRSFTKNGYSFSGTWTHTWTYFDANGNAMPKFIKGQTNSVTIASRGQHNVSTPRVTLADSSSGSWIVSNLIAEPDSATLNGTLTRAGETTKLANGTSFTHTFTMNWTSDTVVKVYDLWMAENVSYLLGTGSSDFKAVGFKDSTFERQVSIVYNGDGTATLTVTRTSGDGKTDTFTIDVRYGIWLSDIRIG
jgi:hypothetical protein